MLKLVYINKQHDQVTELLPWYANRSLNETETAVVEQHLQECKICQTDLVELETLHKAVNDQTVELPDTSAQLDKLMQRIDRLEEEQANESGQQDSEPRFALPMAAAIACLCITALLVFGLSQNTTRLSGPYQVLTSNPGTSDSLPKIALQLTPGTTLQDVQPLLNQVQPKSEITSLADNQLLLSLPRNYTVAEISQLLQQLKTDARVNKVELVAD